MRITDYLKEQFVNPSVTGKNKSEVIDEMIKLISGSERIQNVEEVRKAVFEREQIMSTGVGNGFAIPHGKTIAVSDIVAGFGITEQPVEYDSLDDKPVRLIFILVGSDDMVGTHIKILSRVSRLMNNQKFREMLVTLKSSREIIETFRKEEEKQIIGSSN